MEGEPGLVPSTVYQALQAVAGLTRGRTIARESEQVKSVPLAHIDAIDEHVSRQILGLVRLQLYSEASGGELVMMRPIDLNTNDQVWTYSPGDHKTAHYGLTRTIYFDPQSQTVLQPFLTDRPIDAFMFSPKKAERQRYGRCPVHRRPKPRQTEETLGDRVSSSFEFAK